MPGGPFMRMPFGSRAPARAKRAGSLIMVTISCTSPLAASMPATSSKENSSEERRSAVEALLPTLPEAPAPICRRISE